MTPERVKEEVKSILRRLRLLESGGVCCPARDVSVTPNGNLTSTNVQAALEELQGEIDSISGIYIVRAGENLDALDLIYIAADGLAYKADASDTTKDAKGIVPDAILLGDDGNSYIGHKVVDGFVGLTPNTRYFLSTTPGEMITTTGAGLIVQQVGYAISTTEFYFEPQLPIGT